MKKIVSVFLIVMMLFSIVSCRSDREVIKEWAVLYDKVPYERDWGQIVFFTAMVPIGIFCFSINPVVCSLITIMGCAYIYEEFFSEDATNGLKFDSRKNVQKVYKVE